MRLLVAILLALHALAHVVGVREALRATTTIRRKTQYFGPRVEAVAWIALTVGFLAAAALLVTERDAWSSLLLLSAGASLAMCALAWPQAKVGVFINAALLVLTLLFAPQRGPVLLAAFEREVRAAQLPVNPPPAEVVDELTLSTLPVPVRDYLRFMGVVGRPRDWSLRAELSGRFRREPGEWSDCEAVLYDSREPVARVFMMKLSLSGLPVTVRDNYLLGRGTMQAKAFDLLPVADANGHELDLGELVTYLNDAILMAPSLLLGPETRWRAVDARGFEVTLHDGAKAVTARVWLDERGAPLDFATSDRFFDTADGRRVRTEWRTPIAGWQDFAGRKLPTRAQAVWLLPSGPFAYAELVFEPSRIAVNVSPFQG